MDFRERAAAMAEAQALSERAAIDETREAVKNAILAMEMMGVGMAAAVYMLENVMKKMRAMEKRRRRRRSTRRRRMRRKR